MNPVSAIFLTFVCLVAFVAFGTIAVAAFNHGRRVLCMIFMGLAFTAMLAANSLIDHTAGLFIERQPHTQPDYGAIP